MSVLLTFNLSFRFRFDVAFCLMLAFRACGDHLLTPRPGRAWGKMALSRCNWDRERALLVVKGRIRWRKGRVRPETVKGPYRWTSWTVTTLFRRVTTKKVGRKLRAKVVQFGGLTQACAGTACLPVANLRWRASTCGWIYARVYCIL